MLCFFLRQGLTMYVLLAWNSLYIAGSPQTHRDLSVSTTRMLGLKMYTTMFGQNLLTCYSFPYGQCAFATNY